MPTAARVSIKISREKLKKGDYTPDSEEVLQLTSKNIEKNRKI